MKKKSDFYWSTTYPKRVGWGAGRRHPAVHLRRSWAAPWAGSGAGRCWTELGSETGWGKEQRWSTGSLRWPADRDEGRFNFHWYHNQQFNVRVKQQSYCYQSEPIGQIYDKWLHGKPLLGGIQLTGKFLAMQKSNLLCSNGVEIIMCLGGQNNMNNTIECDNEKSLQILAFNCHFD